jgi:DNA repair photolyase
MPGINDSPEQVKPIIDRARKANASFLGGVALHLRDEVKDVFFAWLEAKRPDLLPRYENLYRGRAYLRPEQRKQTTQAVRGWGRSTRRAKEGLESPPRTLKSGSRRSSGEGTPDPPRQDRLF